MNKKIIMLVNDGDLSKFMYNSLKKDFEISQVIIEDGISKKILIKNRIKRLGLSTVIGQIIFILYSKYLTKHSKKRLQKLKEIYSLDESNFDEKIVKRVKSINNQESKKWIRELNPDIIVVNGTRIISQDILSSTNAVFINTHMGINPKYRGAHGGYWALTQNDKDNCGVSVHLVDKGIDTGGILYQDTIDIDKDDNFTTYYYHQIAKALPLMKKAIKDIINDDLKIKKRDDLPSMIWSHPTIWEYCKYRLKLGVK